MEYIGTEGSSSQRDPHHRGWYWEPEHALTEQITYSQEGGKDRPQARKAARFSCILLPADDIQLLPPRTHCRPELILVAVSLLGMSEVRWQSIGSPSAQSPGVLSECASLTLLRGTPCTSWSPLTLLPGETMPTVVFGAFGLRTLYQGLRPPLTNSN